MSALDAVIRECHGLDIRPDWPPERRPMHYTPVCSEDKCPSFDGKRCRAMGFRPLTGWAKMAFMQGDDAKAALLRDLAARVKAALDG